MRYRHIRTTGAGAFTFTLTGLWCGADGGLYAAGDSRVCVFDSGGAPRRQWTTSRPVLSVAVRNDGAVFAGQAGQIEIFDRTGKKTGAIADPQLGEVTAVGFIGARLFAADSTDRCIKRYEAGRPVHTIGKNNRTNGFAIPNGVLDFTVDANGILCVANPGKHRIERYTAEGELLGHFGRFDGNDPEGFPGCCNPTNVGGGKGNRFYVTEKANPRAKAIDGEGRLIGVIGTDVFHPMCKNMRIAVDSGGRVYVADTVRLAVLVFEAEQAV